MRDRPQTILKPQRASCLSRLRATMSEHRITLQISLEVTASPLRIPSSSRSAPAFR